VQFLHLASCQLTLIAYQGVATFWTLLKDKFENCNAAQVHSDRIVVYLMNILSNLSENGMYNSLFFFFSPLCLIFKT